jgi:uncharacterized protein (DUF488 family)
MIYDRQRTLLALLSALGGTVRNLDFQKLLFLYCQEFQKTPSYEFVPYRFGGFSFTSYADRRRLTEQGLLANEEQTWRLTKAGRAASLVTPRTHQRLEGFAKRYANLRGDALVAEAYRRHPYYAIRSEMAQRLLAKELQSLAAVMAASPKAAKPGICTIGYEGRNLEGYLNRLIVAGVTLLCDVRRNPLSRKYGFSKGTLGKGCEGVGIRYQHLPELGIASDERRELETQADYDALFAAYRREALPKESAALGEIRRWVNEGDRVALTCFEASPQQCHRHCVAEFLQARFGKTFTPLHL